MRCAVWSFLLLVLTQALNINGTLHLEALYFRGLVELLTTTEFLDYTSLLKFSLKLLKGLFNVFALFYGYYDQFCLIFYFVITSFFCCLVCFRTAFWGYFSSILSSSFTSFTLFWAAKVAILFESTKYLT